MIHYIVGSTTSTYIIVINIIERKKNQIRSTFKEVYETVFVLQLTPFHPFKEPTQSKLESEVHGSRQVTGG